MEKNEYKCDRCGNVYKNGWSDEEAESEANEIWGNIPEEERAIICDDCFNIKSPEEIREIGKEYQSQKQD